METRRFGGFGGFGEFSKTKREIGSQTHDPISLEVKGPRPGLPQEASTSTRPPLPSLALTAAPCHPQPPTLSASRACACLKRLWHELWAAHTAESLPRGGQARPSEADEA